ncbi:MAG TPA: histidine phosphatase family protein [Chitinophagaceae bacterium]
MKTVILVRHAKSSWDNIGEADIDRPLNERGKKDAPEMAKRLKKRDLEVDAFITSHAKRARRTARAFAEEFGLDKKDVVINEDLYGAYASGFDKVIASLPEKYKTVALFSHNPGITEFVNTLTGVQVDNMPTAAIFAVSSEAETWEDFKTSEKQFLFFDYPKNPL